MRCSVARNACLPCAILAGGWFKPPELAGESRDPAG
jgi:hypothetical protein